MNMIKKIDHINIVVSNLEETKNFFLNFGFIVQREGTLTGEWIDTLSRMKDVKGIFAALNLPGTETNLELLQFLNPVGSTDPKINSLNQVGYRHVAFAVEDIEKVVADLGSKGIKFFSGIQEYKESNKKLCYFEGPEGIILELAEYS